MAKKKVGKATKNTARKTARKAAARKPAPKRAKARPAPRKPAAKPLHGRAPDFPQITPALTVRSTEDAIRFYEAAFGFKLELSMPGPDGRLNHAQLSFHDGRIMLGLEGAMGNTHLAPATSGHDQPGSLYVYCADVDALTARARAAGAVILDEPQDMFWGDRMAHIKDPDGYRWAFATNQGPFDPSKAPSGGH